MQEHDILHEITPLSDKDCFYIVESNKTEFTFPLHKHFEYELNYTENTAGARRTVGDSVEIISNYDWVLITGQELEHVWENYHCSSEQIREITIQFSPDLLPEALLNKTPLKSIKMLLEKAQKGLAFSLSTIMTIRPFPSWMFRQNYPAPQEPVPAGERRANWSAAIKKIWPQGELFIDTRYV
jgi:hypothetical protein